MKTSKLKKLLLKKSKKEVIRDDMLLHTGSTLLNLACTNNPKGGFIKGKYHHIVGDSHSGKTFLSMTCLAEACLNPNFDDYDLLYDDVEGGNLLNIFNLFPVLVDRLMPPRGTPKEPIYSQYLEEVYYNVDDQCKSGKPFIMIVDSMDGLETKADAEKFQKNKKAHQSGKEGTGTFGTVAKINSGMLRKCMTPLRQTGSILILISQTRDNMNSMFDPKTVSGGRALKFYSTTQIWSSVKEHLKKSVRGKDRKIGITAKIQVKKTRATGRDRTILVPIYNAFKGSGGGFDDIGSMVDYLVEEKHWKKSGQTITAEEFSFSGTKEKVIARIENKLDIRYPKLQQIVGRVWNEIESECSVERKNRYES